MKYRLMEKEGIKYMEISEGTVIKTEQDAMDLIAACFENDVYALMLFDHNLSEEFYKLATGLAGQVFQKLINYRTKAALVIPLEKRIIGRFKELADELNKGNDIRVFCTSSEAEDWLTRI